MDITDRVAGSFLRQAADAKTEYARKRKDVDRVMKDLHKRLADQDKAFSKDEGNWGFVGNLGHVLSELKDINEFLGG